jgi:hypothetical protein
MLVPLPVLVTILEGIVWVVRMWIVRSNLYPACMAANYDAGEEDAPPFIRGGLATTTINEPGARGAAAASIPELGREASARSLGLERSAGSATGTAPQHYSMVQQQHSLARI